MEEKNKPEAKLIGKDGNVFYIIGVVTKALREAGLDDEAAEFSKLVHACSSYDAALQLVMKYVKVV